MYSKLYQRSKTECVEPQPLNKSRVLGELTWRNQIGPTGMGGGGTPFSLLANDHF